MARERFIAACAVALGILIISAATAQAAPVSQGEETSPTPELATTQPPPTLAPGRLGTATPVTSTPGPIRPTPSLMPPPTSGGRVAVEALYVRDQPAFSGNVLGIIPYNQSVYPVGRNGDSSWIAVNWGSARGWVYAEMVSWDPALDLGTLPILVQATGVPPTPTLGASPTPAETLTATASATPSATLPAPTASSTYTPAAAVATSTSLPVTPSTTAPTVAAPSPPSTGGSAGLAVDARLPLFGGSGLLVLAALLYAWQWSAGRIEVRRYARGFILSICPVCQEGHIHLDEVVRKTLGIQWVRRSARCDTCRSVLRELRPGVWRYWVDAFVNPEMAERFKTRRVTTAELQELAQHVVIKPSRPEYDEPTAESLDLKWLEIDEPLGSDNPVETDDAPGDEDRA